MQDFVIYGSNVMMQWYVVGTARNTWFIGFKLQEASCNEVGFQLPHESVSSVLHQRGLCGGRKPEVNARVELGKIRVPHVLMQMKPHIHQLQALLLHAGSARGRASSQVERQLRRYASSTRGRRSQEATSST